MIDEKLLIVKQQLKIENLEEKLLEYAHAFNNIYSALYRIGGPLNDNKLGFNPDQRAYLYHNISTQIPGDTRECDCD